MELYENSKVNYSFCSKIPSIPTISKKKFILLDKELFCDTRIIKEKIDELLPSYISYRIYIDNIELASSMNYSTELLKTKYYYIDNNKKQIFKIDLSIEPNSSYIEKERSELIDRILYIFFISSFFVLCIIIILVQCIKRYKKIKDDNIILSQEAVKLDIIKKARKNIQIFTNKFHKYDKKNHHNYEPYPNNCITGLPITLAKGPPFNIKQVFKIQTEEVIEACDFLIKEYRILHSYNIQFTADVGATMVTLPLEQELFDQIIIGIISNLLLFIKSNKLDYRIHLIIDRKSISFIHDIFNIDETMMIEYSEMIFQETLNPYILTFGQIITILNDVYNLNCKIYNELLN